MTEVENKLTSGQYLRTNMLTFVLVHAVVTVLRPITPPGQRDALATVSTLPLVFSALCWWRHTVLHTNETEKLQKKKKSSSMSRPFRFTTPRSNLYLLVRPVLAVLLAVAEPLFLQALVAVWTPELRQAARGSRAIHFVRAVAAVGISITPQTLRHTLTASTAILVTRTSHQTWKETECHQMFVDNETKDFFS